MPLQNFYTAASVTSFPAFSFGIAGGSTAQMLTQLMWSTQAGMLLAVFQLGTDDLSDDYSQIVGNRIQVQKMWRDGQLLNLGCAVPEVGIPNSFLKGPFVVGTDDGRVARYFTTTEFWASNTILSGEGSEFYYAIDPIWPGDVIVPGRLMSVTALAPNERGLILPVTSTAYALVYGDSGGAMRVYKRTGTDASGTIVFSQAQTGTYVQSRDMLYIDTSTIAIVFRPSGTPLLAGDTSAALLRVFKTTGSLWSVVWEDTLPATDQCAAYDPENGILYSIGKRQSNATLHASLLRRQAVSVASASIIGTDTVLNELKATQLSTIVKDGLASVISNHLVRWTLDAVSVMDIYLQTIKNDPLSGIAGMKVGSPISGGMLVSNYSKTNNSGIATIVYTGPFRPTGLIEHINTAVATVDAV